MENRKKPIPTVSIVAFVVVLMALYVLSSGPAAAIIT
jgi:hypothetical protein